MRESNQALFNTGSVLAVDDAMLEELKRRARTALHRRYRLCLHHTPDDPVQEMIVVHCRENYSRPHFHRSASSCLVLDGELSVFLFDDDGQVTQRVDLGPRGSGKPFTFWIGPDVWHMPVCQTPQLVFYETMTGPFRRDDVNVWAPWSPAEDDPAAIEAYLQCLGIDRAHVST